MATLRSQLDRYKGHGPGFDAARLALSLGILCWHSLVTSYGPAAEAQVWASPYSAPLTGLLPMFFALSGFLVMGSFERTRSLKAFLGLRALRIVPALLTEILISAVLLGSLVTTRSLPSFFGDPLFWKYFGSIIGKVSTVLPGVFDTNPLPGTVNLSLWTIAPELTCYTYLGLLLALRLGRKGVTVAAVAVIALNVALDLMHGADRGDGAVVLPRLLVLCFAGGNLVYLWRDRIPFRRDLFLAALAGGLICVKVTGLAVPALLCLSYVIVFVGCCPISVPRLLASGDYSYGIYLYAFPIQQSFAHFFPDLRNMGWNIAVCLPLTLVAATASWWLVERPALRGRRWLHGIAPSEPVPSFRALAVPTTGLAIYGGLLAISSGLLPSSHAVSIVAAAASVAPLAAALRFVVLRRRAASGIALAAE